MVKFLAGVRSEEGDCLQAKALRDGGISYGNTVCFRRSAIFSWIGCYRYACCPKLGVTNQ